MNSKELDICGGKFSSCYPLDEKIIRHVPKHPGVYVIRNSQGRCFGRLKGKSDILYIGSTQAKNGLRQRLQQYLHPGPTQWTNRRINQLVEKYQMEVSWSLSSEPRNFEHQLLKKYLNDHDELPPLNHAGIKRLYTSLKEKIAITERNDVIERNSK